MFEKPHEDKDPISAVEQITVNGQVMEKGKIGEVFYNGEKFVGTIETVEQDENEHTITMNLKDITAPEAAKQRSATFVYDVYSRTWTIR